MRKTAAIILLMLIAFNTIGYKLWFSIAMLRADSALEISLDKHNYETQDLFTLKIPLNLPYQNIASAFERIDGEITVNGENYKFVQRKVQNDTLYLQCISHAEKSTIERRSNDYFGAINNIAGNCDAQKVPGKNSSTIKFSIADFITNEAYALRHIKYLNIGIPYGEKASTNNSSTHLEKMLKPPQSV